MTVIGDRPLVLVTGSHGLIGTALCQALLREGFNVRQLDLCATGSAFGDVRDPKTVLQAMQGCAGVIHLAAISRVLSGVADPITCWQTNVHGTRHVLTAATEVGAWLIYASSREVYGQAHSLPVSEDAPICPGNAYAQSKAAAELLVGSATLTRAIVRFSSVYGSVADYPDRVIPAFVRSALFGQSLRVEGSYQAYDFTHLDDVVNGVMAMVGRLAVGISLPPIHLVTGVSTTLGDLARMAIEIAGTHPSIIEAPRRPYGVQTFVGDATRARNLLDWSPVIEIEPGLMRLTKDFLRVAHECSDSVKCARDMIAT